MNTPPGDPSSSTGSTGAETGSVIHRMQDHGRSLANELFDGEGLNTVFQHARNILTSTVLIAAGLYAKRYPGLPHAPSMWTIHFAGYAVATLGVLLLMLNLYDGLRRLSNRRHALVLRVLAIFAYVGLSIRLTQVILHFRAVM